ncbi:hypothetical protein BT93_L4482 [Corymbia citriodora subsp. variegata]|uniref:Serine/threonine-protein phosphatase 2A activator n=1 Tax=Corymbia citriodora subsp. variegata TaxID=360336 RepID=A0A8T0CK55_CORYI|nr:hypothetical protein BT93_L4482 [Corymbia citriodora subsp. variegata]
MPSAEPLSASQIPSNPPDLSAKLPKLTPRRKPKASEEAPLKPAPPTPALPEPTPRDSLTFTHPTRRILSPHDHGLFLKSPTYDLVTAFVFNLSDSVRDTSISAVKARPQDPTIDTLVSILDDAEDLIKQCPPEDTGSRFGNPAFRTYLDTLQTRLEPWHARLGVSSPPAAVDEVSTYLFHSLGNWTRIDYGSGHELNFLIWLLCLNRLSILPQSTFPHLALIVFPRYLRLMRHVQTTYYLEPAGSHGVWGLDDYQFAPFLFGASQLLRHPHIRPLSIHQSMILEQCAKDYLYLDQVAFVNSVKNVEGLRWHSPMLDDISAAKNWEKVEAGMKRMFLAEVLGKLPVMQHFLFGSLVPAVEGMSREGECGVQGEMQEEEGGEGVVMQGGMKHIHAESGWGDCCGIKVPSTVGAVQEERKAGTQGLRRVPFD